MSSHPYRILDPSQANPAFAGSCALTVMAKAPLPGKVKTRLSPPLTPHQAADLNACFLRDTVANLAAAAHRAATHRTSAHVVISYSPTGEEAAFLGILPDQTLLLPQRGDSFGQRLLATAEDVLSCGFTTVCLIDSDSPTVPTTEFVTAIDQLAAPGKRAILGPSADGGYYLIGLQRPEANLFDRITWSTALVARQTLERAHEIRLPVTLLTQWYDVDDADSLARLNDEFHHPSATPQGYPAPHTRTYLQALSRPVETLA